MAHLADYERKAETVKFCSSCCRYILPGESYRARVYPDVKYGFLVVRNHNNSTCNPHEVEERQTLER